MDINESVHTIQRNIEKTLTDSINDVVNNVIMNVFDKEYIVLTAVIYDEKIIKSVVKKSNFKTMHSRNTGAFIIILGADYNLSSNIENCYGDYYNEFAIMRLQYQNTNGYKLSLTNQIHYGGEFTITDIQTFDTYEEAILYASFK